MSKICFLANAKSIHTVRWCNYFLERGHQVFVITLQDAQIDGVSVHYVNCGKIDNNGGNWRIIFAIGKVKHLLKKLQPDIIHALYATSYGLLGALSGVHPFAVTALGSDVLVSPANNKFYRRLLRFVFSKAQWITSMSEEMYALMLKYGAAEDRTEVLVFGIDATVFNHVNRCLSKDCFVITSTRNFEPIYHVDTFLDAVNLCKKRIPNLSVNLIGSGSLEVMLKDKIEKLKLADIVSFAGKLTQPEIASYLNQSQIFVSVSSSDGNNISLNEAMACGCFSVVSDIPANRQWIIEGENGFYCNEITAEAIAASIQRAYVAYDEITERCVEMNERIIAERANWHVNMQRVEAKYKQLIQS
jgi:L-malate glycosyltransferase